MGDELSEEELEQLRVDNEELAIKTEVVAETVEIVIQAATDALYSSYLVRDDLMRVALTCSILYVHLCMCFCVSVYVC